MVMMISRTARGRQNGLYYMSISSSVYRESDSVHDHGKRFKYAKDPAMRAAACKRAKISKAAKKARIAKLRGHR